MLRIIGRFWGQHVMRMHSSHTSWKNGRQGTSSSSSGNPEWASSSTCHTDSEGTDSALSLLQRLRSPLPFELARKRRIRHREAWEGSLHRYAEDCVCR